jgi:hypothetical protein
LNKPCNAALTDYSRSSVVISFFAIIILSVIGSLYRSKHHEFAGDLDEPEKSGEIASTIFTAVAVYAVRLFPRCYYFFARYWGIGGEAACPRTKRVVVATTRMI